MQALKASGAGKCMGLLSPVIITNGQQLLQYVCELRIKHLRKSCALPIYLTKLASGNSGNYGR